MPKADLAQFQRKNVGDGLNPVNLDGLKRGSTLQFCERRRLWAGQIAEQSFRIARFKERARSSRGGTL